MVNAMRVLVGVTVAAGTLSGCGAGVGTSSGIAEAPAPATNTFRFAPFTVSYRLATHNRTEQEFGGQVNSMVFATAAYITAVATPDTGGTALHLHVDSLIALGALPPGVSEADLDGVKGATFRGMMDPTGSVSDFEAGEGSGPLIQQLNQSMRRFFPIVPPGGAEPGQSWTDSSTVQTEASGTDIEITTITTYTAGDWIRRGAVRALDVSAQADYTLSGSGSQGGADFVIDGSGVSWIALLLADDGRMVERISADTVNMTASILSMGTIVPMTQVRADSLVVIP